MKFDLIRSNVCPTWQKKGAAGEREKVLTDRGRWLTFSFIIDEQKSGSHIWMSTECGEFSSSRAVIARYTQKRHPSSMQIRHEKVHEVDRLGKCVGDTNRWCFFAFFSVALCKFAWYFITSHYSAPLKRAFALDFWPTLVPRQNTNNHPNFDRNCHADSRIFRHNSHILNAWDHHKTHRKSWNNSECHI